MKHSTVLVLLVGGRSPGDVSWRSVQSGGDGLGGISFGSVRNPPDHPSYSLLLADQDHEDSEALEETLITAGSVVIIKSKMDKV